MTQLPAPFLHCVINSECCPEVCIELNNVTREFEEYGCTITFFFPCNKVNSQSELWAVASLKRWGEVNRDPILCGLWLSLDDLDVSVESRFEWWVKLNNSGGGRDECEHSLGPCVRVTVRAGTVCGPLWRRKVNFVNVLVKRRKKMPSVWSIYPPKNCSSCFKLCFFSVYYFFIHFIFSTAKMRQCNFSPVLPFTLLTACSQDANYNHLI